MKQGLKGRYIDVYIPRTEIKARWREAASQQKMSLSEFVLSAVEAHLTDAASQRSPGETIRLQEENRKLRDEIKLGAAALKQAETDLFRLRHNAFLQPELPEDHAYAAELIKLLQGGGHWHGDKILEGLGINARDSDAIRILSRQLQALQGYGLVSEGPRGWRWVA